MTMSGTGLPAVKVNTDHISACSNKCPGCISWSECGLVAVGSSSSILVCKSEAKNLIQKLKVVQTLNEHQDRVNCVGWIRGLHNTADCHYLLSGSSDNTIIFWKCVTNPMCIFTPLARLERHAGAVTAVDGAIFDCGPPQDTGKMKNMVLVSTGSDCSVFVWTCPLQSPEKMVCLQEIDYGNSLVLALAVHTLPHGPPMLACGLDNSKVNLYTFSSDEEAGNSHGDDGHLKGEFVSSMHLHGHEDWVRCVDFMTTNENDLLLATCSQDSFIRLWKISRQELKIPETSVGSLTLKENKFEAMHHNAKQVYIVSLEAVLSGHEGWVYSVHWSHGSMELLSASMDKSVIIWGMDPESDTWVEKGRFGEVGGNTLGFYGAQFNEQGTEVIAHSYNGALHFWKRYSNEWKTGVAISGHFGPILDITWEPKYGRYILSTSTDQTTRLWSPWKCDKDVTNSWHEIARPQIHGYDMQCVAAIDSFRFVSGGDEKVLRVFEAPLNFLHNLEELNGTKMSSNHTAPDGASVPALGLSNKAVFSKPQQIAEEQSKGRATQYIENQFTSLTLDAPPPEEHLLQNTLWPEVRKLYSHVYEIFCVATNTSGTLIASAAKAATPEHSAISLWCTQTWKEVAKLEGHSLTVTQMEFSNNSNLLLSTSRDRSWIIHDICHEQGSDVQTKILAKSSKSNGHTRIIWSASWTHDDKFFCTASRDKKLMFWKLHKNFDPPQVTDAVTKVSAFDAGEPVTAVAFSRKLVGPAYLLGIGKESGRMELYRFAPAQNACELLHTFSTHDSHASAVKRMEWRPLGEENEHCVATCGMDCMLKIFRVSVNENGLS